MPHFESWVYDALNAGVANEETRDDPSCSWLPSPEMRPFFPLYAQEHYLEPRLPAFRALLLQDVQLTWPDTSGPGLPWFNTHPFRLPFKAARELAIRRRQYQAILASRNQTWPGFTEDLIGLPYHVRRFLVAGPPETEANLRNNLYYGLLRAHVSDLDRLTSVLEIGGGFGSFASVIALRHPGLAVTEVESPPMCPLAAYCLGRRCGGELVLNGDRVPRVQIVPPWRLEGAPSADLAINTMSFQHMDARNLRYYFSHLRALRVPRVFSINRRAPTRPSEVPYLDNRGGIWVHGDDARRPPAPVGPLALRPRARADIDPLRMRTRCTGSRWSEVASGSPS